MYDRYQTIRTEFRHAELSKILHEKPRALLGVTPDAEKALAELDIETVFDLATSAVFAAAITLTGGGTDLRSALARHGAPTADLVRESVTAGKPLAELPFLSIAALQGVPASKARAIAAALDTQTVRDFSLYPPYHAALDLLRALYFPESDPGFDPERPADLVPASGEYPTERVQYQTVLMDAAQNAAANLIEITSNAFNPIDLSALAAGDAGFKKVAFGALLTYSQSWFSQGVTLGQLLHSVALAPGESTRIAVVDWSRRSRAGETEVISEEDELANDTSHNRAISEVTNAVATEAQNGFSHASTTSSSTEVGASYAVDVSSPLGGLLGGVGVSKGGSVSNATATGTADSYSSSFGQRQVATSMGQNIADRTHQNAHSSRTRRASVVKEVAQSEHESVSTRVIANYNHMHALTIQYYEVVQIHRVDLVLAKAERVVFVPVKLMDFADERIIRRFRGALALAALTLPVRAALANLDVIELALDAKQQYPTLGVSIKDFVAVEKEGVRPNILRALDAVVADEVEKQVAKMWAMKEDGAKELAANEGAAGVAIAGAGAAAEAEADERMQLKMSRMKRAEVYRSAIAQANDELWDIAQATRVSNLLGQAVLRADSTSLYLPTDVSIERASVNATGTVITPVFKLRSGVSDTTVSANDPIALSDVTRIDLRGASPETDVEVRLVLTLNRNGVRFPVELPAVTIPQGRRTETPLVTIRADAVDVNLARHLADNRLYYSQAVLRSLDAAQLALLLSGLSVEVETEASGGGTATQRVPLAQMIDPIPIRFVGNYLAFRMSVDDAYDVRWKTWMDDHGVKAGALIKQDIVPLGTGGVFAEAVLGRSNAAEKLDITRFWDWQDSPIPLQPTEIAAIQTGSRATNEDTSPGQLSNPIINITSPTSLPDPVGTAAVLQAIQNGSMFRDMSGLQATIGLLQSGIEQTMAGASAAGQQAGENMNNLLKATTDRQRIGAEMVTDLAKTAASVYTGGAIPAGGGMSGKGGGGGSSSQQGAKINYFDGTAKTGAAAAPAGGAAGGGAAAGGAAAGAAGAAGGAAGGASGGGQPTTPPTTYTQNPAALESVWGNTKSPSEMTEGLIEKAGVSVRSTSNDDRGRALEARKAWPILDPNEVLPRINLLRNDPKQFDWGYYGLNPAGHFFHNALVAKPQQVDDFANTLYASGMAFLGMRKVSPGADIRNIDYGEIVVNTTRPVPPQLEWMLMVALSDDPSWQLDIEGTDVPGMLLLATRLYEDYHVSTGWYSSADFESDTSRATVEALAPDANTQVTIWLRNINPTIMLMGAIRMVTITSPIVYDTAANTVTYTYWRTGVDDYPTSHTIADFQAMYLGGTVAQVKPAGP